MRVPSAPRASGNPTCSGAFWGPPTHGSEESASTLHPRRTPPGRLLFRLRTPEASWTDPPHPSIPGRALSGARPLPEGELLVEVSAHPRSLSWAPQSGCRLATDLRGALPASCLSCWLVSGGIGNGRDSWGCIIRGDAGSRLETMPDFTPWNSGQWPPEATVSAQVPPCPRRIAVHS